MKKYYTIFIAALAAFSACVEKPEEDNGKKEIVVKATIATTKTAAAADGISWSAGDAIIVSCDGEAYNFSTTQSGASAEFTSEDKLTQETVGANPLSAYYGCTQFGAFTIAQNQTISGMDSQTKLPMYAYTTTAPDKGEVSMTFIPAASMLEVTLTPVDITLNKVELIPVAETGVSGNLAGQGTVNPVTGKVSQSGSIKSVSATFASGASAKNGLTFRMPIGWFSVSGGMKLVLTYNGSDTYEELLWPDTEFASYSGSGDAKGYKYIPVSVEMVIGARDYYVAPDGNAASKGAKKSDPTTLDSALAAADEGSVIYLAAGTYKPVRVLQGDQSGEAARKTFEIARGLTLVGEGPDKTILDADGAYHAVCVTAPAAAKVVLKNLAVKGGNTTEAPDADEEAGTGFVKSPVNEGQYADSYGAGLFAVGSDIELENVLIAGNKGKNAVGAYLKDAKAVLKNVEVSGNESKGNGCGLWVSAGDFTMEDCSVSANKGEGVGTGLYIYTTKEATGTANVKNSVFSKNVSSGNNSGVYVRGADATASLTATFTDCVIKENIGNMGGGFGVTYAKVLFDKCTVKENTAKNISTDALTNGANLVYPGSDVTINDCVFTGNSAGLAAAIYQYTNAALSKLTVIGSAFYGNTTAGRGGAIYARSASPDGTILNVANTSIFENTSGSTGSAIAFYSDKPEYPSVGNIYSCTIVNNLNKRTAKTAGGAIGIEKAGSTVHVYNSIVSGNIWAANTAAADLYTVNNSTAVAHKSIIGAVVNDADGAAVSGAPAFNAASMLSKKEQDGKTTVFSLVGSDNPAKTYGYDVGELKAMGASIDGSILAKDQWGNSRSGAVMGAYVE